jgi:hypothetical protein
MFFLIASAALASAAPQNVEAVIETSFAKDASAFHVDIKPPAGTKLNFDGPWELAVEGDIPFTQGRKLTLGKVDFDKGASRFALPVTSQPLAGSAANYKVKYFLCSNDNTWCKRIVKQGALSASVRK